MFKLTPMLLFKIAMSAIALGSFIYGGICLFLYRQQQRIIFFPSPTLTTTPADYGLAYTDVWIPTSTAPDAEKLHGWWIPAENPNAPGLLYLHGNGDNMSANAFKASWFRQLGFSVLMIDYRGYGISPGAFPSEQQVYDDADAALSYLSQELKILPQQTVVFGHSLGGAIAIELVTHHSDIAGLIVEGSFTSILDMSNRTKNYGFLPINWLLHQRFESMAKVSNLAVPVLYVHGTVDETVPMDMSERLYERTPQPKQLLLIPGAGHNNVVEFGGEAYAHAIYDLFSFLHQEHEALR
jgi:fermentation-respiration switch protein FrsA (DUF1100 family)